MGTPEILAPIDPETGTPQQALEELGKYDSENWHAIPLHYEAQQIDPQSAVYSVEGYETTLYFLPKKSFQARLETIKRGTLEVRRRMSILNLEGNVSLVYMFQTEDLIPNSPDSMAQQLYARLQREVDPREAAEESKKRKGLEIEFKEALSRASRM